MESLDDDLASPQLLSETNDYGGDCTFPHHPGPATSSGKQPQDTSDDALKEHSLAFHSPLEAMSNQKFIGKYDFLFFILLITIFQLDCSCSVITFGQDL